MAGTNVTTTEAQSQDTVAEVVLGVDTHLDFHVAVALDELGRRLGELTVPTTAKGYQSLVSWAERFGLVRSAGLEGTGSYGADRKSTRLNSSHANTSYAVLCLQKKTYPGCFCGP